MVCERSKRRLNSVKRIGLVEIRLFFIEINQSRETFRLFAVLFHSKRRHKNNLSISPQQFIDYSTRSFSLIFTIVKCPSTDFVLQRIEMSFSFHTQRVRVSKHWDKRKHFTPWPISNDREILLFYSFLRLSLCLRLRLTQSMECPSQGHQSN